MTGWVFTITTARDDETGEVIERLYTVGYYKPDGQWYPIMDHDRMTKAIDQINWLNGGSYGP